MIIAFLAISAKRYLVSWGGRSQAAEAAPGAGEEVATGQVAAQDVVGSAAGTGADQDGDGVAAVAGQFMCRGVERFIDHIWLLTEAYESNSPGSPGFRWNSAHVRLNQLNMLRPSPFGPYPDHVSPPFSSN